VRLIVSHDGQVRIGRNTEKQSSRMVSQRCVALTHRVGLGVEKNKKRLCRKAVIELRYSNFSYSVAANLMIVRLRGEASDAWPDAELALAVPSRN